MIGIGDIGTDTRPILKGILRKYGVKFGTGFNWPSERSSDGLPGYEYFQVSYKQGIS
jgi:hypothetical protein